MGGLAGPSRGSRRPTAEVVDHVEVREAAGAVDRKADKRIGGVDRTREKQADPVRFKGGNKKEEAGAFRTTFGL